MLTRRRFATAATALPLLAAAGPVESRPGGVANDDLTLILIGDLHSGYRWSSRLLRAVADAVSGAGGAVGIVVNGDVFEHNNVVARRNGGLIDLALLRGFSRLAPTVVTIGNHDSDLFDPRRFATDIADTGAVLLSDIVDPRTNTPYAPPSHAVTLRNGARAVFAALGTPNLALYPPQWRDCYGVPDPARYAATRLPSLFGDAALPVALVHAGFGADRSVLPLLPAGAILHGAHDHLRFNQSVGNRLHLQSGAWSSAFQVVRVGFAGGRPRTRVQDVVLEQSFPPDTVLQALVDREGERWLEPEDRVVIGHLPAALSLESAVARVAEHMRRTADADLALLSHTTFGDGLPAGPVTAFDRAGFLRFDGGVAVGEIAQDRLPALLSRLNQFDGRTAYARRTGDYLHSSRLAGLAAGRPLKVVVNAYAVSGVATRTALFGWDTQGFAPMGSGPTLSQTVDGAIAGGL